MAVGRVSVRMREQILKLKKEGYSDRAVCRMLHCCRKTIKKYLTEGSEATGKDETWTGVVDWEKVKGDIGKGTTFKQLHREHAPDKPYLSFWRAFRRLSPVAPEVTMRLFHKPGEQTQIDFCDGIPIVDRVTGTVTKTQFFCGVLAFSSYVYGEFVLNQKLPTFIECQNSMWAYFGGVTPYVVVDNLKSGVTKAHLYDPDVNPTYCDYANHMGFGVLPARPYHPRDKAGVECNIGVVQRNFFQEVRDRTFYLLSDLNEAFLEYLKRLNTSVMKEYGVSRETRFLEEKNHLKPLPQSRFELTEWRFAKVHPDCHIQIYKNFYSVPFTYVGQAVRVRVSDKIVEIFQDEGDPIGCHARLSGIGKFSTIEAHYPEAKAAVARFEIHRAKEQANRIGPDTCALVTHLFEQPFPLRYLRRVQGVLRLVKQTRLSVPAVEYGCRQAMLFNKMRLSYIKSCADHFHKHGTRPVLVSPKRELENLHLHQTKTQE